jgi:hypothetical protein
VYIVFSFELAGLGAFGILLAMGIAYAFYIPVLIWLTRLRS